MPRLSTVLEERYAVQMGANWKDWFDGDADRLNLPGPFRTPAIDLDTKAPKPIWPGMMLPYTLPILSNGYGDWLCVTVDETNAFGELIHWYHGGGDWIPVGNTLQQAALHDCIDCLRPKSPQMLRSALEADTPRLGEQLDERLSNSEVATWFSSDTGLDSTSWNAITDNIRRGDHASLLRLVRKAGLCVDAVACDRIEQILQPEHWEQTLISQGIILEGDSKSERTRKAFDPATFGPEKIQSEFPQQDWAAASEIAAQVLDRRIDLAWAHDIAGWSAFRIGNHDQALEMFAAGERASAFSSQAVRLKTHFGGFEHNKFCIERVLQHSATPSDYASLWRQISPAQVQDSVQMFWLSQAESSMSRDRPDEAYWHFIAAGWDIGFASFRDCAQILQGLVDAANRAGWQARSRVAATHLACLQQRIPGATSF